MAAFTQYIFETVSIFYGHYDVKVDSRMECCLSRQRQQFMAYASDGDPVGLVHLLFGGACASSQEAGGLFIFRSYSDLYLFRRHYVLQVLRGYCNLS